MNKKPYIIAGIIITLLIVIGTFIFMIMRKTEVATIAIIGGADGPTHYYFSFGNMIIPVVLIVSSIIVISIIYFMRKNK